MLVRMAVQFTYLLVATSCLSNSHHKHKTVKQFLQHMLRYCCEQNVPVIGTIQITDNSPMCSDMYFIHFMSETIKKNIETKHRKKENARIKNNAMKCRS